jgi:DNA-binding LacI/PurR family transcriptional regulator
MLDVASRAGVSKSLVSLVMRDSAQVSEKRRAAVLAAAAELGYRPNAAARNLKQRRSNSIGVHILDLHNPVYAEIVDGVSAVVHDVAYTMLVVTGGFDPQLELRSIETLLELQVEGLILIAHRLEPPDVRRVSQEVPTAIVLRNDVRATAMDTVANDDALGALLAVEHLAALGHRRIGHVSGGSSAVAIERKDGYLAAMRALGLAEHAYVVDGGFDDESGYRAASEALSALVRPTALFVANDFAALGAMAAARNLGLEVPRDVSVVGYDGMALSGLRHISLTTVVQPLRQMGRLAAEALLERINGGRSRARNTVVEPHLVIRDSSGPVTEP